MLLSYANVVCIGVPDAAFLLIRCDIPLDDVWLHSTTLIRPWHAPVVAGPIKGEKHLFKTSLQIRKYEYRGRHFQDVQRVLARIERRDSIGHGREIVNRVLPPFPHCCDDTMPCLVNIWPARDAS